MFHERGPTHTEVKILRGYCLLTFSWGLHDYHWWHGQVLVWGSSLQFFLFEIFFCEDRLKRCYQYWVQHTNFMDDW